MKTADELLEQEQQLLLPYFNNESAWRLGTLIRDHASHINAAVAIDIHAFGQQLFFSALQGSQLDNLEWIRRKRQSVLRFGHSTLYLRRFHESKGRVFEEQVHIDVTEYSGHGGGVPLRLKEGGLIGAVCVSGLPDTEDHAVAVQALLQLIEEMNNSAS